MKIYQVDAFTDQPFKGNPAAVCVLEASRRDDWMQRVAQEMNLSETAFLLPDANGFALRWFTPKREVNLCGHATLASAHILWEELYMGPANEIKFSTRSGLLVAQRHAESITLDFPARFAVLGPDNRDLNRVLGITPIKTLKLSSPQGDTYLLEVESASIVRNMSPNFEQLATCPIRSVIVTSLSDDPKFDFVSRYFSPGVGVREDPVTGAAHCYLAPYWGTKLNKKNMIGFQASERGGVVGCLWSGERVHLRGTAVTIFKGDLLV